MFPWIPSIIKLKNNCDKHTHYSFINNMEYKFFCNFKETYTLMKMSVSACLIRWCPIKVYTLQRPSLVGGLLFDGTSK